MKNFICFGGLFKLKYLYLDAPEYLADSLFVKHKVHVDYSKGEWHKDGEPYVAIECKIKRKDKDNFEKALGELNNKMLLCHHNDYEDWCNRFMGMVDHDISTDMKDTE